MPRPGPVVLALALLLAGCAGFVHQDSPETVTPAAVPTPEDTFPPGVRGDAVAPSVLATAHARSLTGTNYTLVHRKRVTDSNGTTLRQSTHTRWVSTNSTVYAGRFRQNGTEVTSLTMQIDYWTNGSIIAARYDERVSRPRQVKWSVRDDGPVSDHPERRTVLGVAQAIELSVADRTESGGVVLVGHRIPNPD
ncbi:MAG: hypothetical protein ABEH86_07860 [Haloarcula sp.]